MKSHRSHRIVTVAGSVLFGVLLLGAPEAAAAPAPPNIGTRPTEISTSEPCRDCPTTECPRGTLCPAPEEPCETDACPPAEEPEEPGQPEEPEGPAEPEQPADGDQPQEPADGDQDGDQDTDPAVEQPTEPGTAAEPSARPVGQPRPLPAGVPVPTRIDTGEGPADP
ncbi:MAG: hypothetical protein ACRDSK_30415, partial [Actinophytocola sp.]